jgi:hydroxyacylglutathione hydrolase
MLEIEPIPAFADNYIWLLRAAGGERAAVVDPGDADPVIEHLRSGGLTLASVLITHHHGDHVGGLPELLREWPAAHVFGPADRRIRGLSETLGEGARVRVPGPEIELTVMAVPGHTSTHIAYYGEGMLFCGDTLFAAGCGRVFDGSVESLAASLERIAALPGETRCYCAHEYTLANLGFARWVEPDSAVLARVTAEAERLRAEHRPTVPTAVSQELAVNPFLRTAEPVVKAAAEGFAGRPLSGHTQVFSALRRWKDERYD